MPPVPVVCESSFFLHNGDPPIIKPTLAFFQKILRTIDTVTSLKRNRHVHETQWLCAAEAAVYPPPSPTFRPRHSQPSYHPNGAIYVHAVHDIRSRHITQTEPLASTTSTTSTTSTAYLVLPFSPHHHTYRHGWMNVHTLNFP